MLLHNYLQLKSAILTKAKAEVDNLLKDITDPEMKEAVDDWDLGDPITDLYPQVDQKKDEPVAEVKPDGSVHTLDTDAKEGPDLKPPIPAVELTGQNAGDVNSAGAQLNHQPDGQLQQEPAGGNPPA
jgi:hypothetical protein